LCGKEMESGLRRRPNGIKSTERKKTLKRAEKKKGPKPYIKGGRRDFGLRRGSLEKG